MTDTKDEARQPIDSGESHDVKAQARTDARQWMDQNNGRELAERRALILAEMRDHGASMKALTERKSSAFPGSQQIAARMQVYCSEFCAALSETTA